MPWTIDQDPTGLFEDWKEDLAGPIGCLGLIALAGLGVFVAEKFGIIKYRIPEKREPSSIVAPQDTENYKQIKEQERSYNYRFSDNSRL